MAAGSGLRAAWPAAVLAAVLAGCAGPEVQPAAAVPDGGERARLRAALAERYFEPDAHLALARHLRDAGEALTAFFICESARRTRFTREVFDTAFTTHMHAGGRGPAAPEQRVPQPVVDRVVELVKSEPEAAIHECAKALREYPDSPLLLMNLAISYYALGRNAEARPHYEEAARLAPRHPVIQGRVGRFLLKGMKDGAAALPYYLRAYFLDPHYYDGEYTEARIRSIAWDQGHRRAAALHQDGTGLADIARDRHDVTAGAALREMSLHWQDSFVPTCIELMGRDDPTLRWQATALLLEHGAAVEPRLDGLLNDDDLRRRGLAFYLAVKLRDAAGIAAVAPYLEHRSQLLRFDAFSALKEFGGEVAAPHLEAYAKREQHPWMRGLLERAK